MASNAAGVDDGADVGEADRVAAAHHPRPSLSRLPTMAATPADRLDKWLWAVRLFKTRSLAAAACTAGKVRINGAPAKPSRAVRPDDVVVADTGVLTRTVKVKSSPKGRVGARGVAEHLDDLTPASEYDRAREKPAPIGYRPPGSGRPTKRDRRILQSFFGLEE